jgi:uroporphyrinogen-III decarboxylase
LRLRLSAWSMDNSNPRMTHRQRLVAALERREPDWIPWFPRLEIWYEANLNAGTLPSRYQGIDLAEIYRLLGMGRPGRDPIKRRVFYTQQNVDMHVTNLEDGQLTECHTPYGSVSRRLQISPELRQKGVEPIEVEHLIKGPEDYAPVEYIYEHTDIMPCYEAYMAYELELGEEGIPFVFMGQDPMSHILVNLIGYNDAYYHLADYPEKVDHLYRALCDYYQRVQQIVLESPARLIMHGQHFDSGMTPPRLFRKYMVPYFQPLAQALHGRGKWLAAHADADTSRLMHEVLDCGFDVLDCFVTAPMVPLTMAQARTVFREKVTLWGGIPSVLLESSFSENEFRQALFDLFAAVAPGRAIILGVADNVMPESSIERIEFVSRLVETGGQYPLDLDRIWDALEL